MKKSKSILMLFVSMLIAATFTACDNDDDIVKLPEATTVKYSLSVSPDFLQFYNITVNYKTAGGVEKTETVTESPWKYEETITGRYYTYKFNSTATLKAPYTIPAEQTSFAFRWSASGKFTNNTASNTYLYNPSEMVYSRSLDELPKFFEDYPVIKLTEFEGDKTPK